MNSTPHEHVSDDRLQALVDGALQERERGRVEEHLAVCRRCCEELESWRSLFEDLSALPRFGPGNAFGSRVLSSVRMPVRAPLAERLLRGLLTVLPSPRPEHPSSERLQDFVDEALPARQVARLRSHLGLCPACSADADAWRVVYARLGAATRFAPSQGFGDRVMSAVRVPSPTSAPAATSHRGRSLAGLRIPEWRGALAAFGRFVPKTREAWAALSGVALTPAVTVGLLVYTVFSHPTLTPGSLGSFMIWKVTDLFAAGWTGLETLILGTGGAFGVDAAVRVAFEAPFMLAGGAVAYSVLSVLALRVLYKNLSSGRTYARVFHS